MQEFGSVWTTAKLDAIEKYLNSYTMALKKQHFKLCYIDAFAGSGSIKIKSGEALNDKDVEFHNEDCNSFLLEIDKKDWMKDNWRGVIFLDLYAMDLEWDCLNKISATKIFDVWYFFPFMAVNRNLRKNGKIPPANRNLLNRILGPDWEQAIYSYSPQMNMFDEKTFLKENVGTIQQFIIKRLEDTFPTVSKQAILLRNERNSPQFMLCFAGSNPGKKARKLSLNIADSILIKLRDENGT